MQDGSAAHRPPPGQAPRPAPEVSAPLSPTHSGRILVQTQNAEAGPSRQANEGDTGAEGDAAPKPKKPRLPRCKSRKQRCIRNGPGRCTNCEGVKAECIIAPRAKRKNAKKQETVAPGPLPTTAGFVSVSSPSSLSNLLRNDHFAGPLPPPNTFMTAAPFYGYPPIPFSGSPPIAPHPLPQYAHNPQLAGHRPAFHAAPPPPLAHSAFPSAPVAAHTSPVVGSPNPALSAPISAVRSDSFSAGDPPPSVSAPSTSTSMSPPFASATNCDDSRRTSLGGADETPLPIKGDGDAMEYDEDEEDEEEEATDEPGAWHDKAARGVAFLSLSANGNPTYIGPSSGFSWARMVLAGISGAAVAEGGKYSAPETLPLSQLGLPHQTLPDNATESISDELARVIFEQTYRHVQPRYSFVDWLYLDSIWPNRHVITQRATQPNASKPLKTAAFFIWMIFAIGSRFCQKLSIPNLASAEAYYAKAMEHLETIVGLHDLKNVQALILMVMFSFRSSEAPSIWYLVGIIMRLCCSLGLHRRVPPIQARRMSPYILQLRRRIFWTAYTLDRMMAMSLGRPTSIPDHDIDIELPLDYHCGQATFDLDNPPSGPTSMTSSIQFIKLMRIESLIQKTAYRVDKASDQRPEPLLRMIDEWVEQIPAIATDPKCHETPCCSRDWFLSRAADARMYLLRPHTTNVATAEPELVKLMAKYAAEACAIQQRIHQSPTSTTSLEGLRSVFLCGLTLLHAVQVDRSALPFSVLRRATSAMSNTLFVYSNTYKGAAAYHEVFDALSDAIIDKWTEPDGATSSAPTLPPNLQTPAATPLFQSLWEDIPSVMTHDTEDSFAGLLESLGLPADSFAPMTGPYSAAVNGGVGNDLDVSEIGGFVSSSGLAFEPFALGSSAGGLW